MKIIDWFISLEVVQKRLKELGWMPPAPRYFGPFPSGGPSPNPPNPPSTPSPQPSPPPNDN